MKKFIKCLSIILIAAVLLLCCVSCGSKKNDLEIIDNGYVKVTDFGANGMDKEDDSIAFAAAIDSGKNIYVPSGDYYLSETINISDRIIRGAGPDVTTIYGTMADKRNPIMVVTGVSSVCDMRIHYPTMEESLGVQTGEKVAIQLGSAEEALCAGSVIRSLSFSNVGTALYNPDDAGCSGVIFENMEIFQLYRGVDMRSENRVGNSFSNVYIGYHNNDKVIVVDCGFSLDGSSYGETIHQLNVEHNSYNTACVVLKNAKNVNIDSMHFEGVHLTKDNSGWIYCENTSGYIGSYANYLTYMSTRNNSMVYFGDSDGSNTIIFDTVENRGLNNPNAGQHADWVSEDIPIGINERTDFRIFRRAIGAKGEYNVVLNCYGYYTLVGGDNAGYLKFVGKGDNLNFTIKNEPVEGTK